MLTAKGKLRNTEIRMYGEEHNNIDNQVYEALDLQGILMVEHSTLLCHVKPEEIPLFKNAKGSEWVFFTQKMAGNQNIVCFDTRLAHGYLTVTAERMLHTLADKLPEGNIEDIKGFLDPVLRTVQQLNSNKDTFDIVEGYIELCLDTLQMQLKAITNLLRIRKSRGVDTVFTAKDHPLLAGIPLRDLLIGIAHTVADNLKRVCSVSVDMGLIRAIHGYASEQQPLVHVFAGKNHIVRVSEWLNLKIKGLSTDDLENAKLEMDSSPEMDEAIAGLKI